MTALANSLGALALLLTDAIRLSMDAALDRGGETSAALITLGAHPGLLMGELSERLALSQSGGVRLVERLAAEGWVERHAGQDGRTVVLKLSDSGQAKRRQLLNLRAEVLDQALKPLSSAQQAALQQALHAMLRGLVADKAHAHRVCRLCDQPNCKRQDCPVQEQDRDHRPLPESDPAQSP